MAREPHVRSTRRSSKTISLIIYQRSSRVLPGIVHHDGLGYLEIGFGDLPELLIAHFFVEA